MRKHDVRKWLHAVLDLLPVILIPVFMIYSHRHTLTERIEVEINYKYQSNEVNSLNDLVEGNIYYLMVDNDLLSYDYQGISDFFIKIYDGYIEFETEDYNANYYGNPLDFNFVSYSYSNDNYTYQYSSLDIACSLAYVEEMNFIYQGNGFIEFCTANNLLPTYSSYNVIESVSVNDTNKDIMTVFMDDFNGAIDKYFNMGNVFNLNGVYQWFNTNIFSGNAPTVIYSIWNIALYELVMDLLFLLYGLFMWFIDMVEHLMEKPFKSIK